MNNKTCNMQIDELAFTFKVEANVMEEIQIKQKAAEIAGGMENLISLESVVSKYRTQMFEYNKQKFGEDYESVKDLVLEDKTGDKTFTDDEKEKRSLFLNNEYTAKYLMAQQELSYIKDFATLIVLCVKKPNGFEFLQTKTDTISKLIEEYKKQTEFFRKPKEKATEADKS